MEFNLKIIMLLLGIIGTGLTAGLCFTWSNAVTPGIGMLDDLTFLKSFKAMNRAIINRNFLFVFFGPILLLFLNIYFQKGGNSIAVWAFSLAAVLFFIGVFLVTVLKNVPLNELLDKTILEQATQIELADLRNRFEQPWNRWHMVRTVSSTLAFTLLLIGLLFNK